MNAPTDQMAIWALVCSIVGFIGLCCFGVGGLILGPVAFFLGNSSLNRINASGGSLGGLQMAQIGRILGIIVAILGLVILAFVIIGSLTGNHTGSNSIGG